MSAVNRAVLAQRAASNPRITARNRGTVATDPAMRVLAVAPARGALHNRRASKRTGAQRNSIGRLSEWSRSPYAPRGGWR